MKKILYINGNPQKETASYSRRAGIYYQEQLIKDNSDIQIDEVNVYEDNIQLIDEDVLNAWQELGSGTIFSDLTESQQEKISNMNNVLNQFKEADEYVLVTPLWNFSIPPMLKAYLDNISIAGETFKYTESGPVGLLGDKKVTIIQASGSIYTSGPAMAMDFGAKYLEVLFGFLGVKDIKKVYIEGIAIPNKTDGEKLEEAYRKIDELFVFDKV